MDRISELPESLQEKILLTLLSKDAIRMRVSSREWQSVYNSLPVTDFNFKDPSLTYDSFRSRLPELEGQKRIVRFSLVNPLAKNMTFFQVDRCIKLVTQYDVTELELSMGRHSYFAYKFPPATFDVGSLVLLSLTYCTLEGTLIQKDTIFSCLKELRLCHVNLNGLGRELFSRLPSLESLELKQCSNIQENIQRLELYHIPNLKNVFLDPCKDNNFKIEAPNLESLVYYRESNHMPLNLELVCCRNLKKLDIIIPPYEFCRPQLTITNQNIEEVFHKFPFLEDLVLEADTFGSEFDHELKISSHQLKIMNLRMVGSCWEKKLKNINIDASNLLCYELHTNNDFLPSISLKSVKLEKHNLRLSQSNMDTKWFLRLRKYLGNFPPGTSELTIYCPYSAEKNTKWISMLRQKEIPPRPKVKELTLVRFFPYFIDDTIYATLLNGLLWSCHPMHIRVELTPDHRDNNFLKFIYKMLMDGEGKPHCCQNARIKCWRHYLKSVRLESYIITKDGKKHCCNNENSTMEYTEFVEAWDATFALQWF